MAVPPPVGPYAGGPWLGLLRPPARRLRLPLHAAGGHADLGALLLADHAAPVLVLVSGDCHLSRRGDRRRWSPLPRRHGAHRLLPCGGAREVGGGPVPPPCATAAEDSATSCLSSPARARDFCPRRPPETRERRRVGPAAHRRATSLPMLTDVDAFIHSLYPHVDPCQLRYEEERLVPATAGEAGNWTIAVVHGERSAR